VDSTTRVLTILIILFAFAAVAIAIQFVRRRRDAFPLVASPAYEALPQVVGAGIESGRPVLIAWNSIGAGGTTTPFTLLAGEMTYQVALRAVPGGISPVVAVSEFSALPLAYGTLARAHRARGRLAGLNNYDQVAWVPGGPRSLAFAALMTGLIRAHNAAGAVFTGSYGAELALPLWSATRQRVPTIAATHDIEGQAVAFALADYPMLGDEFALAGAYLGSESAGLGSALAAGTLRAAVIVGLLIPTLYLVGDAVTDGAFSRLLAGLLGGGS
jgi:hypothetical protein